MRLKNDDTRYGLIAILFHWVMAIVVIGLLITGLYMTSLAISLQKLKWYGWHKEWGLLVLGLVIMRIIWCLYSKKPILMLPQWEKFAAHSMHWALYGFMFAMPITGWLLTSAAGLAPSFFGLFTLPALVAPDKSLQELFSWMHEWLGYGLIAAILLHTLAALKHHFINKDDILRRMTP